MRLHPAWLLLPLASLACAPTIGPVELPTEAVVVLDGVEKDLRLYDVDSTAATRTITLSSAYPTPTLLAVHGEVAAVGFATTDSVALVNLVTGDVALQGMGTGAEGSITALAYGDDGTLYAGRRATNIVTYLQPGGAIGSYDVTGGPQGFGFARGNVFVVAGNRDKCDQLPTNCDPLPSFLIPLPVNGKLDTIPLIGEGNASAAVFGPDGFLYVLNPGNGSTNGQLSQVNPVTRVEQGSFSGFGKDPEFLASDGVNQLYVASTLNGLMVFNTSSHAVTLGPPGVPVNPVALVADDIGRAYVVERGSCQVNGVSGRIRVFGTDLVERQPLPAGICPVAAATTELPASAFLTGN